MTRYLLTLLVLIVPLAINALNLDGVIDEEWENALRYELSYEIDPAPVSYTHLRAHET